MKNNITALPIKGSASFGELLEKVLETTDQEQKDLKVLSGIIILETDQGVAYFNLQRDSLLQIIGLLEVAKVFFVDELGNPENS